MQNEDGENLTAPGNQRRIWLANRNPPFFSGVLNEWVRTRRTALRGAGTLDVQQLARGALYYLGTQRIGMRLRSLRGGRVLLIGGPPFPEAILMWWNFVARTPDEIRQARDDWEAHRRFGEVEAYNGPRLRARELIKLAPPNPVS